MSSTFKILANFKRASGRTLELASRAELQVFLGATNVTEFTDINDRRSVTDHLDIPAYYLAEWLAENWWALLHEPRKSEDNEEDDTDFLSRHSFLYAQQGYALPSVKIVSNGNRAVYVSVAARNVPLADIRFLKTASLTLSPESVATELRKFIHQTVESLDRSGVEDTELHDAWELLCSTSAEEETYCRMIGALGLSPYAETEIDEQLFELTERTSERVAMDLCLAAKPEDFPAYAAKALKAHELANTASESDLSPLLTTQPAPDRLMTPAWKRGVLSAERVRESLGLSAADPNSGSELLSALGIDTTNGGPYAESAEQVRNDEGLPILGAVARDGDTAKIGLLQTTTRGRRFGAARGAFAAWISAPDERRLLTQAVTRDQQSSRAFAAEILAPIAFLRKAAGPTKRLVKDQVDDLADELGVYPGLVWKQAQNNGMIISYH